MSVITSATDEMYPLSDKMHCSLCEEQIRWVPFIVWRDSKGLYLCSHCCQHLVKGLAADLIQIDAIVRIQELGYPGFTLHRETQMEQTRRERLEAESREAEIWRAVRLTEVPQ